MRSALFGGVLFCIFATAWSSRMVCADVSSETLSRIRGNTVCAVRYPTTGGCTVCQPNGTMLVTYSYVYNGVTYTYSVTVPIFKKCNTYAPDDKCMTHETFLSWCNKATVTCPGAATGYSDSGCSAVLGSQPPGGFTCGLSYISAATVGDTGLTCTGVTFGIW